MTIYQLDKRHLRRHVRVLLACSVLALPLLACSTIARVASPTTPAPGGSGTLPPINLPPDDARRTVVEWAYSQLGKPYTQWPANPALSCGRGGGGCTRNGPDCWDCSGFTHGAYRQVGVELGPTTYYQINDGVSVEGGMETWNPGDLLLFCDASGPYHVALYAGNGQMIHSANCADGVIAHAVYTTNLCSVRRMIG